MQFRQLDHPGGWKRGRGRFYEVWLILTGRFTLHKAWQNGYDQHTRDESARRAKGGK